MKYTKGDRLFYPNDGEVFRVTEVDEAHRFYTGVWELEDGSPAADATEPMLLYAGWVEDGPRFELLPERSTNGMKQYDSGMLREDKTGKPRFDLMWPEGVPFSSQLLTRFANLLAHGAEVHGDRNWERGYGDEEMAQYKDSCARHHAQWMAGETDEDHAAAVMFNLLGYETGLYKREVQGE